MRTGFILTTALSLLAATGLNADALRVKVSDLLINPVKGILTSCATADPANAFEGSISALAEVRDGTADLALVAVPDGETPPDDMVCIPFAFDVATVVVNNGNPIKQITLRTLASAFARSGGADKWGSLGLKDVWAERSIAAYIPESSSGVTLDLFRSMTIKNGSFRDGLNVWTSRDQLEHIVREQAQCLVILRGIDVPNGGRALLVSETDGQEIFPYPPTESSVFYGDYPLRLPFYIVFRKDASQQVKDFAALMLSDETAKTLSAAGLVPAPKSERDIGLHIK
ncbi:MAG: substrate-binding domain-containing protein [Opitutales bacterium]|jgi:ABC-type phosphate transport system substrate-binding protein